MLHFNPILATDSYKLSHAFAYPYGVKGMFSYIEARTNGHDTIVPFGLQMWLRKFMTQKITFAHIQEAEIFATRHGEPFARSAWEHIVKKYNGYFPVTIRAVPEGTPVPSGQVVVTIECIDPIVFWLSSYLETALQRAIWYPTTIASMDYDIKRDIKHFYEISGADMGMLPFALHDFGARGVSSSETAEIGGAAHMVNFMGSDNIEGIRAANYYYYDEMAGFSVPATEHSVECSFGLDEDGEYEYLNHVLVNLTKPGGTVSIVIDGRDTYRCVEMLCTQFKDRIITSGTKVVFRPDSGDMQEVVPRILRMQELAFGSVTNASGYKKINNVGILQGDGVDHMSIKSLLGKILSMGFSADNVVFGSGGALLQKVNRDTYKFAQKASAVLIDDTWVGIAKDPITDPGKRSKSGRLTLVRSKMNNEYMTVNIDRKLDYEFEDVMKTVYTTGCLHNLTTLAEVRKRAEI
jgi:nicotinamide phosphoribosyltransferase